MILVKADSIRSFILEEAWVSPAHIISVELDKRLTSQFEINDAPFPDGLLKGTQFTKIRIAGALCTDYLSVVGTPESIANKL